MQEFVDWAVRNGSRAVRRLEQKVVTNVVEVEKTFGEAADKDWEGIILRLDAPYEGKRRYADVSSSYITLSLARSARIRGIPDTPRRIHPLLFPPPARPSSSSKNGPTPSTS